jgi:hypothetical protein
VWKPPENMASGTKKAGVQDAGFFGRDSALEDQNTPNR